MLAGDSREPNMDARSELQPGLEVVGIVDSYLAPDPLGLLGRNPLGLLAPTPRGNENVGGLRGIETKWVFGALLVVLLRLALDVAIGAELLRREASGDEAADNLRKEALGVSPVGPLREVGCVYKGPQRHGSSRPCGAPSPDQRANLSEAFISPLPTSSYARLRAIRSTPATSGTFRYSCFSSICDPPRRVLS
jgi:hypothetical protein